MGALIIAKNKRIDWIDTAKGIGIILVVFAHTKFFEEIDTSALNFLAYQIYSFHMPLFFIISGICLCISEERSVSISCDFHSRIKKITKRLLPPYFLWSVVYIVINLILGIVNNEATLVRRIGGNIYATLTGRGMAPLWFLFSLWVAEILVLYINYWIGGGNKRKLIIVALFLVNMILGCLYHRYNMVDLSPLVQYIIVSVFRSVLALFFVLIGFELKNLIQDDKHDLLLIIGSVAIWLSILLIRHNSVNMHTYGFESIGLFMITGTMGSYSILKISKLLKNSIFLRWAGENSLNIMALHYQPMPFMYLMSLATMPIKIVTIRLMISTLLIFITLFLLIKIWNAMQTGRLRGL